MLSKLRDHDEIYEHINYDNATPFSFAAIPSMFDKQEPLWSRIWLLHVKISPLKPILSCNKSLTTKEEVETGMLSFAWF